MLRFLQLDLSGIGKEILLVSIFLICSFFERPLVLLCKESEESVSDKSVDGSMRSDHKGTEFKQIIAMIRLIRIILKFILASRH